MAKAIILDFTNGNGKAANTVRVTDMQTGETKVISIAARRVMRRANRLFQKGKELGVTDVPFRFFLDYSWKLEKGHVWA